MTERDPLELNGHVIADKYKVERLVGEGGFAVVYRAQHTIWNKPVAIKFFSGLSSAPVELRESLQQAFIQEGALLTELSSQTAGIVQARDIGACTTPSGQWAPYMVLEWLEGRSLEEVLLADRKLGLTWSVGEVMGFLARVLPSLQVAHERGVAHRDIKPANLFVMGAAARSEKTPIKLLDFGVAKMVSDHEQFKAALARTGVGISSFTPQYGAPEQFTRSYGATGPWTDVYAMALVSVEMLLGKDALQGEDLVQLGFASANPKVRPTPRGLGAVVPDAVEAVFARALAVEPESRYANAMEFLAAAVAAVEGTEYAVRPPASSQPRISPVPVHDSFPPAPSAPPLAGRPSSISRNPTVLAASNPTPPQSSSRWGVFTTLLALLVVGISGVAVFAASDLDGASEARAMLLEAYQALGGTGLPFAATSAPSTAPDPSFGGAQAPALAPTAGSCPTDMALVPGGVLGRQLAAHGKASVELDAYCLDRMEVTAEAYAACVARGDCAKPATRVSWPTLERRHAKVHASLCNFGRKGTERHPMNCIDWKQADAYCKSQGRRLPSEAEWELAASGTTGRRYPWGDEEPTSQHLDACDASCRDFGKEAGLALSAMLATSDEHPQTAPVGSYEQGRTELGIYDLAGNVREWVGDFHGDYPVEAQRNPSGPKSGKLRVVRGGGWDSGDPALVQTRTREAANPHVVHPSIGFRCAMSPSG